MTKCSNPTKFYICNKKRPECINRENHKCMECKHTSDIEYALYKDHTDFNKTIFYGEELEWEVDRGIS